MREVLAKPGLTATYRRAREDHIPSSAVRVFELAFGPLERRARHQLQWLSLHGIKANGEGYRVWLLTRFYPPQSLAKARQVTARYVFQGGDPEALEFSHRYTGEAVLPSLGAWGHLIPRSKATSANMPFPGKMKYLGRDYSLAGSGESEALGPPKTKVLKLLPDVLVGVPHNARVKDDARRYDGSDYEYVRLRKHDYEAMIQAGMNCFRVDGEQADWIRAQDVFYWGLGGAEIRFPEELYRSNYLGPELFLDEPAVCTRDGVIRPSLEKDRASRRELTVQKVLEEFKAYFRKAKYEGRPSHLIKGLKARQDLDPGDMWFVQENMFSWETMVSTAVHQLGEGEGGPPSAMVFEPPGRFGTMRILPEMNMAYGCQIPVDDPKNLASIIVGFLRGAARLTHRAWGLSIYGQVDRADGPWLLTHAYNLGASFFFYWDSHQLACVPRGEYLALSRMLMAHVKNHPRRDMESLRNAAETLVLLPPGYNLGHVDMGRGNLWGLGELNLERVNGKGIKHRVVMANFFTEIERCLRLGVAFDLVWDLPGLDLSGYREVIRIEEDGTVQIIKDGRKTGLKGPRKPARPDGVPPKLEVGVSSQKGKAPLEFTANASVVQGSARIYYTVGADSDGVYHNDMVLWELFGPGEEDYLFLNRSCPASIVRDGNAWGVRTRFSLSQPGSYRLRAATVDMAGRTAVVWMPIVVKA